LRYARHDLLLLMPDTAPPHMLYAMLMFDAISLCHTPLFADA